MIAILFEGGKLFVELPIQGRFELTPRGGASFLAVTRSGDAEVDFVEGKDGAAGAVATIQGARFRLTRVGGDGPASRSPAAQDF